MRKSVALGVVAALGLSGQAFAAEGLSYNFVEVGYVDTELDLGPATADGDGFQLAGSAELGSNFNVFLNYGDADLEGVSLSLLDLGAGYHWSLNEALDLVGGLSYERFKVEGAGAESGFGLSVGLRGRVGDALELNGGFKYVDFGDGADDTVFSVGARYYFTEAFAAGIDYRTFDDLNLSTLGLTLRYDFGSR